MDWGSWNFKEKPSGVWKSVLSAPSHLYRWNLGFLLGKRFLLIEHTGRRSGRPYRTTVEVVEHRTDPDEYVVRSGTGPGADWYRNITAAAATAVRVGNHRWVPRQRLLGPQEAAQTFARYEHAHPKAARRLLRSMGSFYDRTDAGRVAMMEHMPMVAFAFPE